MLTEIVKPFFKPVSRALNPAVSQVGNPVPNRVLNPVPSPGLNPVLTPTQSRVAKMAATAVKTMSIPARLARKTCLQDAATYLKTPFYL